jgi:hypothetical protein
MRKTVATLLSVPLLLAVAAAPAWGHATFPEADSLTANSDQHLSAFVSQERGPSYPNIRVVVVMPAGWTAQACDAAAPWHCQLVAANGRDPAHIEWLRDAGAPAANPAAGTTKNPDEWFSFAAHTGTAGSIPVPIHQYYSDGKAEHWDGPAGSSTPAPVLKVAPMATPAPAPGPAPAPVPAPVAAPAPAPRPAAAVAPAPMPAAAPEHAAAPAPRPGAAVSAAPALPHTGASRTMPLVAGFVLLVAGVCVALGDRRRQATARSSLD